jgi:flagellar protein FliT
MIMMNGDEVLSIYENVASITGQMLCAAREKNWDRLIELESLCTSHVDRLRSEEPVAAVTGSARERKVQIIMQILDDDRQIRAITEPWMEHLSHLISSVGTERRLAQTYGAHRTG